MPDTQSKPPITAVVGTTINGATFIEGGIGRIKGLRASGVSAGFRRNPGRRDLALVVSENPAVASAVFTKSTFAAAPVLLDREHLKAQRESMTTANSTKIGTLGARAILLNSGNANAATGAFGEQVAKQTATLVAQQLDCQPEQVFVASTGVIGVPLGLESFAHGIPLAFAELGEANGSAVSSGCDAAAAIMTTDTHPKQAAVTFSAVQSDGVEVTYTIAGMVKGSGMIEPHMATLLGVVATDAMLEQEAADLALKTAIDVTLNKVTVDSDTSTNDSVFFLATGATPGKTINSTCPLFAPFLDALTVLLTDLARQIAYDGEGATKLVTVNVKGAANGADADKAGRAIANSPLVKTAIAGHDANWGRIAMALGKSGAEFAAKNTSIAIMGLDVCKAGLPVPFDEDEALKLFKHSAEIVIDVDLGAGVATTQLWTCDMTHEYISINGDYRT